MRKLRVTFLFVTFVIMSMVVLNIMRENASAYPPGWSDDIRLTIADNTSTQPIATLDSNGDIYLVWADERDGNYEIYLKNSTNNGVSWNSDLRLTNDPYVSNQPQMAIDSFGTFHLVWREQRSTIVYLNYMNSTDGGSTWSSIQQLYSASGDATANQGYILGYPQVAIGKDDVIHVVFSDDPAPSPGINGHTTYVRYLNSTNLGVTWSSVVTLGPGRDIARWCSLAADKSENVYVAWHDWTGDFNDALVNFVKSLDNGGTWTSQNKLINVDGESNLPFLAAKDPDIVYLVFRDDRNGNYEIYYKISVDAASTWGPDTRLTFNSAASAYPKIYPDSVDNASIVWQDSRDSNREIYYAEINVTGDVLVSDTRLTDDPANSATPFILLDPDDRPHIFWPDDRDGNYEIYYKRFAIYITDVTADPDPQEVYGNVNISVVETSNVTVFGVWVEIYDPDGGSVGNLSMLYDPINDRYYWNQSYDIVGTYSFTIWANDTTNYWSSASDTFVIQDSTPPTISDVVSVPDPQEVFGNVNITANCTDNYQLFGAWVEIYDPDGGFVGNISMLYDPINDRYYWNQSYDIVGTYSFTIWANDTSDNWMSITDVFIIRDTTPPTITDVISLPNPQEVFGNVNITANITDAYQLFGAWAEIYDPDGTFIGNLTLLYEAINDRYYWNQGYDIVGTYTFTIWVNDTSDNWDSVSDSFVIQDTAPPVITVVNASPDPQEVLGNVNITANVTDNYQLFGAWVEIYDPDGDFVGNISMLYDAINDRYYWNQTYDIVGTYSFTIWANDTSDCWASVSDSFVIQDTTLPEISNVQEAPDPQEGGSWVNISCDVTDNVGVYNVWVNITQPDGGYSNVSMIQGVGNQWYYNNTYATLGLYHYTIGVNDTSNNWNSSSGHSFTIQDTTIPEISNVIDVPDPQETGGYVNISCDLTDNVGVYDVWVNITLPDGGYSNVSLTQGVGNQWYYNNTYVTLGLYQYTIWANDTSDNWNSSSGHSYTIRDSTIPELSNVIDVPDPQETGGYVNISCDVTDNVGVYNVWVNITLPGGGYNNISMTQGTGDQWYYNDTYVTLGSYQYTIWVNDTSDNWAVASGSFIIQDTTLPMVDDINAFPDPQEVLENVMITANVTDNYQIFGAWIEIYDPDGGFVGNISMLYNPINERYYWNQDYDILGTYTFTIWANDTSDNWASASDTFVIQDTTPPVIADVEPIPNPQEVFRNVNISAYVIDSYQLMGVWVEIYDPDGGFVGNFLMLYDSINDRYYWNQSYDIVGTYTFTIWANDTRDNWLSVLDTFVIQDTTPPKISDVISVPDTQEVFRDVNISANVIDNCQLFGVWAEICDLDGSFSGNFSMLYDPINGRYYLNKTYDLLGTYTFTIWANDTSDNWASVVDTFVIQDNTKPIVSDVIATPNPQEVFGYVNISSNVIDTYELSGIWLEIFDPYGIFMESHSILFDSISGKYYWNQTYNKVGTYTFTIWANDTSENFANASDTFVIQDTTPPTLTDIISFPDPQEVSENVNITVHARDNYQLFGVWVEIHDPDGNFVGNLSMLYDPVNERVFRARAYYHPGIYNFTIWANDTSDNWAKEEGTFVINPVAKPEEYNWKPFIALIFTTILLVMGILFSYLRPLRFWGNLQRDRLYTFLLGTLPFVCVEMTTGIISLLTGLLRVPPVLGIGLIVDLIILLAGILTCLVIFIKGRSTMTRREEAQSKPKTLPPPPPHTPPPPLSTPTSPYPPPPTPSPPPPPSSMEGPPPPPEEKNSPPTA